MLRSCDGLRLHYAEKDAIIFFCAPLLRQLPLRSLLCLSLCESCRLGSILEKMTLFFLNASVVPSASSVRCVRMQRLRSWARLHVRLSRFACMLRLLSPAIVRKTRGRDCGQRLSRKGARPYHRRCHTRFTRESKRRLQTTHVWATRKYRRARSSPTEEGREGGPLEAKHGH